MRLRKSHLLRIIKEAAEVPVRQSLDLPIPSDLEDIHRRMKHAGRELYVVGGAVRDILLGKTPKDYDVATNASPEEVIKILRRDTTLKLDLTGKSFGVVRVKTKDGGEYEIATFREDIGKGKGTSVKFSTIENDVRRRDLTINALFYDMDSGEVVDYVGGIEDIENGVIRAVGDPVQRFDEDRLRILRAARFAARTGSSLDPATEQAILEDNALIDTETGSPIPGDRITEEFVKGINSAQDVGYFFQLLSDLNLFPQILPSLSISTPTGSSSNNFLIQLPILLRNNEPAQVQRVLKSLRYSNDDSNIVRFFLDFLNISPQSAPKLKKEFKRVHALTSDAVQEFGMEAGTPAQKIDGFLNFIAAPPAANSQDLMAQGITGPALGAAMADAEIEAYKALVNEALKFGKLRMLIREQMVQGRKLDKYTTAMSRAIVGALKDEDVKNAFHQRGEVGFELAIPELEELEWLNGVIVRMNATDGNMSTDAKYEFDLNASDEQRRDSDIIVNLHLPANYENSILSTLIPDLKGDLRHELEHSSQPTETLMDIQQKIPDGEIWQSLQSVEDYFTSEAEVKAFVSGIVKRAKTLKEPAMEILDDELLNYYYTGLNYGFSEEELDPLMKKIRSFWQHYMSSRWPEAAIEHETR